jgi:hypothetical protein
MKKLCWADSAMKTYLKVILMSAVLCQFAACSKTVQWEEEVPLNTGEVIWVKRTVEYTKQGGAGNPFDVAYRPGLDEKIEFTWRQKKYVYDGDARIMLLAISPNNVPVLVAKAADNGWQAVHKYACTYPFYVQLVAKEDGHSWVWPRQIEAWLYNLPANLMLERLPPGEMRKRYTAQDRRAEDLPGSVNSPSKQKVDPSYTGDLCKQMG